MSRSLYVATIEPESGKALITLGLAELLSRRVQRLAFFRPIIRGTEGPDADIELIRQRYCPGLQHDDMYGVTHTDARRLFIEDKHEPLQQRILERYRALAERSEFVICEGTDFSGVDAAFEFTLNARIAQNLGAPVVIVVQGRGKSCDGVFDSIRTAREGFEEQGCSIVALIVNRVPAENLAQLRRQVADWKNSEPVYLVPAQPVLERPTVGEVGRALNAKVLRGSPAALNLEALDYKVAAMHLPHFLEYLKEGTLVVTPADRADIILASVATIYSENYPAISGLVLTGGFEPPAGVMKLLDGLHRLDVPVLLVPDDTFTAATKVSRVKAVIGPDNDRKIAAALGILESNVPLDELEQRIEITRTHVVTPLMFEYELIQRAKAQRQHVVLPEGEEPRILQAADILLRREVVDITLLGNRQKIHETASSLGLDVSAMRIINPADSQWQDDFARTYYELRRHKGVNRDIARDLMLDVSYFGTMMVYKGLANAMVSGAIHTTGHTIRPALQFIGTKPGRSVVSSVFFMCLSDRVLVYGDCAIIPNPTPEQLADIAISSAETAEMFDIEPRVAMLSYSTGESGAGEDVDRVRQATELARSRCPSLKIDGPIQYDAAVDASVGRLKLPGSEVAGKATVFVFPDLNTGNNTYKAVQRSAGAVAIGPVLQGLKKPVNDLSRGCTVSDIVNTVAITAIQAQSSSKP